MPTQTINISLPQELIKKIDNAARAEFASRSDYIRQALVGKLKADQVQASDWDLLEVLSAEIADKAAKAGYKSDRDFVGATKQIRRNRLTEATKK